MFRPRPGREADHTLPSFAKVKDDCDQSSSPQYVFVPCTGPLLLLLTLFKGVPFGNFSQLWQF
jgi:hypothetical protein